jgi:hypothetical protein
VGDDRERIAPGIDIEICGYTGLDMGFGPTNLIFLIIN